MQRRVELTYLAGLAYLGLGQEVEAEAVFEAVLEVESDHFDALCRC
jgi:hypothetical protein